ncbi:TetR/AcrR family transcriptional regulator [Streptomyces melanosporofaciens]|uniref:DNA-binding transcriptional regulator, AcrR family n=1 Tax=Streptomyces melanosporofaciens TaxID=67327 RepID=A0A1H4VSI3_STRMJ|nr:TetR/AcrR family transcriptional regulator [Streptomyces melanosporofaciens]SEC84036.1 DNA-binding transcriptional regulator, AcrR family [Streptomyces melanosporofaciens]
MSRSSATRSKVRAPVATERPTRRRGTELTQAIYEATLRELADTSFEELSFESVASAAGTGKSVLYRRWNTTAELVLAALKDCEVGLAKPVVPDTGTLRGDLIVILSTLAQVLDEPRGRALWPLLIQRARHPELFHQIMDQVSRPHRIALFECIRGFADQGEVSPARATERIAAAGPRLIIAECLETGSVAYDDVVSIVDEVLLPLLTS